MNKHNTSNIEQDWPAEELEIVIQCPYCDSKDGRLAFKDVQDWTFYCAPGKWSYWCCANCEALYLNPRPKEEFIYKAYASYYTHVSNNESIIKKVKEKIINECYSHWLNTSIKPRLNIPKWSAFFLNVFKKRIQLPFELEKLVNLPKGHLLDIGCGSGTTLLLARQLGWKVTGIEIDPKAVAQARAQGLNVIQGDFRKLKDINQQFDCIICSHVLEHVYEPKEMLSLMMKAIEDKGILLLSLPNSKSNLKKVFGKYWRGLEAPRHISMPSDEYLMKILSFNDRDKLLDSSNCLLGSIKISQNNNFQFLLDKNINIKNDFINIVKIGGK